MESPERNECEKAWRSADERRRKLGTLVVCVGERQEKRRTRVENQKLEPYNARRKSAAHESLAGGNSNRTQPLLTYVNPC